jgi:N-acetylneuraminate synthase/pseudaminic acid synthase
MPLFDKLTSGVYTIAEMSANHAGSLDNALEIVRAAKRAGADCLKIQTYTADTITIDCDAEHFMIKGGLWDGYKLYDLYGEASTPWEWHRAIKDECGREGLDFLSTPFDRTAVDFLEELGVEFFKVASFELVDIPLIEYAASKGKPMVISCGMGSPEEIQDAVDACRRQGSGQIVLLKCCSEYPASFADMNLATIPDMMRRFGVPVGLSDHSMGSVAAVVGVSLGACVVEKHFCLSRKIKNPDSEFSMEPDEFVRMVADCKAAAEIRGCVSYDLTEREMAQTVFRRSLYAVRDISQGERFTSENVRSIRPGYGLAPKLYNDVLGRKALRDVRRGEPLSSDMLGSEANG